MRNAILFLSFFLFLIWSCRKSAEPIPAPPTYLPIGMYYFYDGLSDTSTASLSAYFEYDMENRLIGITETNKLNQIYKEIHQYSQDGNLQKVQYIAKDSSGLLENGVKLDFFYNNDGRLSSINNGYLDNTNGQYTLREQYRFQYNAMGKLTERYDTIYRRLNGCNQKDLWVRMSFEQSDSSFKYKALINNWCYPPWVGFDMEVSFTNKYKNPFHFVKEYIPDLIGFARFRNYPIHNYRGFNFQRKEIRSNREYLTTNTILQFKADSDMPEIIRWDEREVNSGITATRYYYFVYKKI